MVHSNNNYYNNINLFRNDKYKIGIFFNGKI